MNTKFKKLQGRAKKVGYELVRKYEFTMPYLLVAVSEDAVIIGSASIYAYNMNEIETSLKMIEYNEKIKTALNDIEYSKKLNK